MPNYSRNNKKPNVYVKPRTTPFRPSNTNLSSSTKSGLTYGLGLPASLAAQLAYKAGATAYNYAMDDRANRVKYAGRIIGSRPINQQPITGSLPKKEGYQAPAQGKSVSVKHTVNKVPVSKLFKDKVESALLPKEVQGKWNQTFHGVIKRPPTAAAQYNFQAYSSLLEDGSGVDLIAADGEPFFELFSPRRVLDQASRLFNGKTGGDAVNWLTTTAGNFLTDGLELKVPYQKVHINVHNNTEVVKEIDLYQCTPKLNAIYPPMTTFENCLSADVADGKLFSQGSISGEMYGVTPSLTNNFSTNWKSTVKQLVLAPGQSTSFDIIGPSMTYHYDKYKDLLGADVIYPKNIPILCFYIVRHPELLNLSNIATNVSQSATGHITSPRPSTYALGVTIEIKHYSTIIAPEITPDANKFRRTFFDHHNNWSTASSTSGNVLRIIPEVGTLRIASM